eukprot:TRINITY_DN43653_c0_g1_i1.p1 TRINITY_DN43653_c0_g1~~TRINITY_DN43653_c0_g1_i1.p1  ORF type:complete len:327 (-),score=38.55 TRINITY_DN43653_c0_g1_i1:112-1092(-)
MFANLLLTCVPTRHEADRAALTAHATMLAHGFVVVASTEAATAVPSLLSSTDGSVNVQIVPPGWNMMPECYSFNYMHPLRGQEETFNLKALVMAGTVVVHGASCITGGDLLTVSLEIGATATNTDNDAAAVDSDAAAVRVKSWQEKVTSGIALKLLDRHNCSARLGKVLATPETQTQATADGSGVSGTKRPAPEAEDHRDRIPWRGDPSRSTLPDPGRSGLFVPPPAGGPIMPGFFPEDQRPPLFWTPNGGLLGPRHPAWGQVHPFGGRHGGGEGGGGMMPRFDPIGPGGGVPNADHLRVPGLGDFPGFHGNGQRGSSHLRDPTYM